MKIVLLLASLALSVSCRSTRPAVPAREPFTWTRIPSGVLDSLCATSIRNEGIGRQTTIHVVPRSQSLVSVASLIGLRRAYFVKPGKGLEQTPQMAQTITAELMSIPVDIPQTGHSCAWAILDHFDRARDNDKMILQISTPFANPYSKTEWGAFARLTVGGEAASWFWVPMKTKDGAIGIGHVMELDVEEH
jgi:hypothetical protein